jgi:hypothetical protein
MGNPERRDHLETQRRWKENVRIYLKCEGMSLTDFMCLKTGKIGGLLREM